MAKQINEKGKPCLPCYTKIQESERLDNGLIGVNLLTTSIENQNKLSEDPNRYYLRTLPGTYSEGIIIKGSSTFLNKYSLLKNLASSISEDGPTYVDTRDNKIEIHNGKRSGKSVFSYSYAGGTGELLEFSVQTKYTQSIEAGKASDIDPDTKFVNSDLVQCVPTNDDPCKPDAYVSKEELRYDRFRKDLFGIQSDSSKVQSLVERYHSPTGPKKKKCTRCRAPRSNYDTVYKSEYDAKQKISSNPSLTIEEIQAYNNQIKSLWDNYIREYEAYQKNPINDDGTEKVMPFPPDEVANFVIHRKVRISVDPIDYSSLRTRYYAKGQRENAKIVFVNNWRNGYNALKVSSDKAIIIPSGGYKVGDRVIVEMDIEVQIPGVRVVSDPLFTTLGNVMTNDIIESVNSQIKAKAKFVGNPLMESSQIIEIKNVGDRYSGDWYTKEVEHGFDSGGYFTEVTFEKKSRNSILNKVSTKINMQEVFQKAHKVAKESYTTGAWKIPSQIKAEAKRHYYSSWDGKEKEGKDSTGHTVLVDQHDNPQNYNILDARADFRTDLDISTRD